jgi:hypothetical protein
MVRASFNSNIHYDHKIISLFTKAYKRRRHYFHVFLVRFRAEGNNNSRSGGIRSDEDRSDEERRKNEKMK